MKKVPIEKLDVRLLDGANDGEEYFETNGYRLDMSYNSVLYALYEKYVIYIATEDALEFDIKTGDLFVEDEYNGRCPILKETLRELVEDYLQKEIKIQQEGDYLY